MEHAIALGKLADIAINDSKGFDPFRAGRDEVLVVRLEQGFYAYFNACPHKGYEGTSLCWRRDKFLNSKKNLIVCSGHGAQFSIAEGTCVQGPCQGQRLTQADVYLHNDTLYWRKQ